MAYDSLKKIQYKNASEADQLYNARYNSPTTVHFDIKIKQFGYKNEHAAFFCYCDENAKALEKIYLAYIRFNTCMQSIPPVIRDQFAMLSVLDEVKASNDIEGVQSTRKEIRDIMDGNSASGRFRSVVAKYRHLLHRERINLVASEDIRKLYDDFAHDEVIAEHEGNQLDGEIFRRGSVDIQGATGKTIHRGVYPESRIITCMNEALKVLHESDMPLLYRVAIFHYFFAFIHPFYDGNGRTDRFISTYMLTEQFDPLAVLRLSLAIKKRKKVYYELFNNVENDFNRGDLTIFVNGFLSFILDAINDATALLERKNCQYEKYKEHINQMGIEDKTMHSLYLLLLQSALMYGKGTTMNNLMSMLKKSRNSIMERLNTMPPEHLIKSKSGRAKTYRLNLWMFK